MIIRPTTQEDTMKLLPMIKSFCEEMNYPFEMTSLVFFILECHKQKWMLDVVEEDGEFLGLGGVALQPHFCNNSIIQGIEYVWHSLPSLPDYKRAKIMLALLSRMESFTEKHHVPLVLSVSYTSKLGKYLEKKGYNTKHESQYRRD